MPLLLLDLLLLPPTPKYVVNFQKQHNTTETRLGVYPASSQKAAARPSNVEQETGSSVLSAVLNRTSKKDIVNHITEETRNVAISRPYNTYYYLLVERRISKVPEVPPTSIHDRLPAGEVLEDKNAENASGYIQLDCLLIR